MGTRYGYLVGTEWVPDMGTEGKVGTRISRSGYQLGIKWVAVSRSYRDNTGWELWGQIW